MSISPSTVTLPTDSANTGKNIDNVQLTNSNNVLVQRQVSAIGDPQNAALIAPVSAVGLVVDGSQTVMGRKFVAGAASLLRAIINLSASGDSPIVSPSGSLKTRLYRLALSVSSDTVLTFKDSAGTALSGGFPVGPDGGLVLDLSEEPWFETANSLGITLNSSVAVNIGGMVYYAQF